MYRAAKRDSNEREIIQTAQILGATVSQLDDPSVPDLLIGFDGKNYLVEVKTEDGKLTVAQKKFFATWEGQVTVVRTPEEIKNLLMPALIGGPATFNVLDKGYVEIQDVWGNDLAIVNAARTSYMGQSKGPNKDKELLNYLMKEGHHTPFEHAGMRLRVKAPGLVFNQWVRHRIGSFSVQSRRYTEIEEEDFYVPEVWRLQDQFNKQGSVGDLSKTDPVEAFELTEELKLHYDLSMGLYKGALSAGVAREQARLFVPFYALYTTFVWSVNLRSLMNFLHLRTDAHAQWEIQQYANCIKENIFVKEFPQTAEAYEAHYK